MSTQEYIRSVTDIIPDDMPSLETTNSNSGTFSWQTWLIIILILALLGINVFAYLAKGTEETASLFQKIFGPILAYLGYSTLETTRQTVENTAEGTKAGVDIVADTTTNVIDTIEDTTLSKNVPQGKMAKSSLPVQQKIQHAGADIDKWQQDSLAKSLEHAKQNYDVMPNESKSSVQTTGQSGWCYIGEEQGIRTCAEVGLNDVCMSGDVFPNQAICMNPNLRV